MRLNDQQVNPKHVVVDHCCWGKDVESDPLGLEFTHQGKIKTLTKAQHR